MYEIKQLNKHKETVFYFFVTSNKIIQEKEKKVFSGIYLFTVSKDY